MVEIPASSGVPMIEYSYFPPVCSTGIKYNVQRLRPDNRVFRITEGRISEGPVYYTECKPKNKNRGGQGSVVRDDSGNFKEIEGKWFTRGTISGTYCI